MTKNPGITVVHMESALNHMQNSMVSEDGSFNLDDTFFEIFDKLMIQLQEAREVAENLREISD